MLQAIAMGEADRNVGKVSGRAEFYQRLKALSVAPVKEPIKGQAIIVGVPSVISNRISAIKALRELTFLGLKEAKDAIDCVHGHNSQPQANYHFPLTDIETANRQAKAMREAGCTVQVNLS
jgi:ribosomal protein L7/L12